MQNSVNRYTHGVEKERGEMMFMRIMNLLSGIVALLILSTRMYELGTMFLLFNIFNNLVYYGEKYLDHRNIVEIRHKKLKFEDDYNDEN